jgi:hypothetical protein
MAVVSFLLLSGNTNYGDRYFYKKVEHKTAITIIGLRI